MDQLQDLRNLVFDLREMNRLQKEKEARDGWTKYVSLSMIIVAVLATVAGGKGGGFSSTAVRQLDEATYVQAQASDQWSFYQAKALKQALAEDELARLKPTGGAVGSAGRGGEADEAGRLSARIARYDKEKAEIQAAARGFEANRDQLRAQAAGFSDRGGRMGLATSLFQVSIALGGVCLIMKKRWIWWLSLVLGAAALVRMAVVLHIP